jgi:hypothetical protein
VRFVRFIFHARVYRDPVHFPSLAPIVRECLFKTARIRSDVRYNESNKDGPLVHSFLREKLAAAILELANRGWTQCAASAVGEIQAPLAGLGIVKTQVQTLDMTGWPIDLKLNQICAAIPNFSDDASAFIFDPLRGAG